jgi:NitT/TauT family transport system permease protein
MTVVRRNIMGNPRSGSRSFGIVDGLIVFGLIALLYVGIRFASPVAIAGPEIDLAPSALPKYVFLSLLRMTASYFLSLAFSLVYAYIAAHNRTAERVMLPILDVLQSVPLLSFLPVVLLLLTTVLPSPWGVEASAVVLIFTSQAWNIAYSFHQSIKTAPRELQEASATFRFNWWYRLRYVELPFGTSGLLWNSIVSWANGWFFLMAAETFRANERDFRLPGVGSYLQAAADAGDGRAIILGFIALILMVMLLDQLLWQPLLAWAEKYKVELVENDSAPRSWFLDLIGGSQLLYTFNVNVTMRIIALLDRIFGRIESPRPEPKPGPLNTLRFVLMRIVIPVMVGGFLLYMAVQSIQAMFAIPISDWGTIAVATAASTGRVLASTALGLLWTVPVGVLIGTNPTLSARIQPIIQSIAAVPATAFFPVLVGYMVLLPFGLDAAAILLMMFGTQWYLLFNVIAGATALPQELKDAARLYRIRKWARWRTLILPALLPYIVTGLNIAGGGAWNASIVAEYTQYKGQTYSVIGLGSVIADATSSGNYALLLAATLTMIITVIAFNTFLWQRLHHAVQDKYRMD